MMEDSLRFAAVDIGSNAVRLFFSYVFETKLGPVFKKASLIRLPIRLGEDSFHNRPISDKKVEALIDAMKAFSHLKSAYEVKGFRVCATSAMRDAKNGAEIIKRIKAESGVQVELIDGEEEAALIYENHIAEKLDSNYSYIYMDVGGGSTEYTVFENGRKSDARSFNIGTIRLKENLVDESAWDEMRLWLEDINQKYAPKYIIGSGGNINTVFKLSMLKPMQPLSAVKVRKWRIDLSKLSFDQMIAELNLRPDRADVIIPAIDLFLFASRHLGSKNFIVPKVGLVDGIVHQLYEEYVKERSLRS
jgi:exopolyphosphatase/guanosine-5'-triphosphate,3'-diphosphate pyrophosphatase